MLLYILLIGAPAFARKEAAVPDALVPGNTHFALDLFAKLKNEKGNLFLSPYSISSALAMTYAGARGVTADEIGSALHFTRGPERTHADFAELHRALDLAQAEGHVRLHIANALWPQRGTPLLPEYLSLVKRSYGVSIAAVDYRNAVDEARRTINDWTERRTERKITDLLGKGAVDPSTVLVLTNAVYFKGAWEQQFDPRSTMEATFFLGGGKKKPVRLMSRTGPARYGTMTGGQVLELPYQGRRLSLVVLLPDAPESLPEVENRLTVKNLEVWRAGADEQEVHVYLPKFRIVWGAFDLSGLLQTLGMRKAFIRGAADFSGMDGSRSLFLQGVIHLAAVEVNEEGTEAAAATAVAVPSSAPEGPVFMANRPFLFLIRDTVTGSILFLGRLCDPAAQNEQP